MSWFARMARNIVARLPGGRRLSAEIEQSRRQAEALRTRLDKSEDDRESLRARLEARRQRARAPLPDEANHDQVLPLRHSAMVAAQRDATRQYTERAEAD
jgi:hypothetical protein